MKNTAKRIKLTFRNDDPSAVSSYEHEKRILELFDRYDLPQTISFVPYMTCGDRHCVKTEPGIALEADLKIVELFKEYVDRTDSEIALHGYTHQTNRFSNPRRREYYEFRNLPGSEQEQMIFDGRELLQKVFDREIVTFVPPWNRLDDTTLEVLKDLGFLAISCESFEHDSGSLFHYGNNCDTFNFPDIYKKIKRHDNEVFLNLLYHSLTTNSTDEIEKLEHVIRTAALDPEIEVLTIKDAVRRYGTRIRVLNQGAKAFAPLHLVRGSVGARAAKIGTVVRALPVPDSVELIQQKASELFFGGEYEAAAELAGELERLCWRRIQIVRWICGVLGLGIALMVCHAPFEWYTELMIGVTIGMGLLGWSLNWKATSPDTKREMQIEVILMASGLLLGVALVGLWNVTKLVSRGWNP